MRDYAVLFFILGTLPFILRRPYIGVLVWSWLGYMNPHRLTWSFAYDMPFAQIVAITLLLGLLFNNEPKRIPVSGLTITWTIFILWMCVTTALAVYPDGALAMLTKVMKIQVIILVTMMVMVERKRIDLLIWVIVVSIGYFSVKGGVFTLVTAGAHRVWGPPGSFIEGNNELALATLMVLPLMWYLRSINTNTWVRWGLLAAMILSAVSVAGSQSRGALLGGLAMASFFWMKGAKGFNKVTVGILILVGMVMLFSFMPEHWHERMATIINYKEDESAMGRINSWIFAFNLASDRITAGGFQPWSPAMYQIYNPGTRSALAAHSIYFSILGEHGWFGLFLFLLILFIAWRTASWIIRQAKGNAELEWLVYLSGMLQVSLVAYCVGGAFLSLSYYDLPWHMISLLVLGKVIVQRHKSGIDLHTPESGGLEDADRPTMNELVSREHVDTGRN